MNNSIYWDCRRLLTYNALIYIVIGNRGGGKSFGCKWYAIDNFIKKGEQFGYIRRYKDDLIEPMNEFFNDILHLYPDYEFKTDSKHLYIRLRPEDPNEKWTDNDIAGYGFTLSTASNKKSIPYPKVTTLIFDEFLLDEGLQRYLKNEPKALLNLYETVARPGSNHPRVIMFMLANSTTITNPYFLYWDIKVPDKKDNNGKWIWRHPTRPIVVEDVKKEEFIEAKRKTDFGQLIKNTDYEQFSLNNKYILDNDTFVCKRSPKARFYFSFTYKEHTLGVWADFNEGCMYVSKAIDPSYILKYSITMKDHKPNMLFIKNKNKNAHFKNFLDAYNNGCVYFEDINIKNICYEVIKTVSNI